MHEVVCVSISADLHVHLQILSLIFVSFISINALWHISCLPMVFITFSICTKDAPFKLLTYISDQNIQRERYIYIYIYIYKTGRTDVEAETPILWPPDAKS